MTMRRDVLAIAAGGVAAMAMFPAATAQATWLQDDRDLLALGALFDRRHAQEQAAWRIVNQGADIEGDDDPRWVAAIRAADVTGAVVHQIHALPATTLQGVLVKARALSWCTDGEAAGLHLFANYPVDRGEPTTDEILIVSILGDLHRMTGGSSA